MLITSAMKALVDFMSPWSPLPRSPRSVDYIDGCVHPRVCPLEVSLYSCFIFSADNFSSGNTKDRLEC